ncbi:hypothetical protein Amet_0115 [Alkaliphilus metalliredigens QYMF]|uniref:IS66 family insertion sequence element accessory protein TnpB n=1 Tax=Alkaliphilus metalliredigens (strain QYMF) TaxID=293826 RepID=A6TJI8_ALKMQ|nr:hypothetical protein [Alkaliphilus metalliredigens]ABR46356.1 hypothetical protein Amet_0115 [Alkaliphilus metalliredigens QYMF]
MKSSENKEKWQLHINSQLSSGQTQIQWCEEQGVKIHSFRYWKNRLQIKPEQAKESTGFVAIKPVTLQKVSKMRIRIGKATVEIDDDVDPILLTSVIRVLTDYV